MIDWTQGIGLCDLSDKLVLHCVGLFSVFLCSCMGVTIICMDVVKEYWDSKGF